MKRLAAVTILALSSIGVAQAGDRGAGPGGTGSLAAGTLTAPETLSAAFFGTTEPGKAGTVRISAEQAREIFDYLSQQAGAVVSGTSAAADGTFPGGGGFRISVDTAAGTLNIARR